MTYFVKVKDDQILKFPYTMDDLLSENPNTQYDVRHNVAEWYSMTEEAESTGNQVFEVKNEDYPEDIDQKLFNIEPASTPVLKENEWVFAYLIIPKTEEEIEAASKPPAANAGG